MTHASLIAIASEVRAQMVVFATESGISLCPDDLDGACACASWVLSKVLRQLGAHAVFVGGDMLGHGHCWVEVGDTVVDVTAGQFGQSGDFDDVVICKREPAYAAGYIGFPPPHGWRLLWDPEDPDFKPALEAIVERVVGEMERMAA